MLAGDRPGVQHRHRPPRIAAIQRGGAGAVRIFDEQLVRPHLAAVGVFPAGVDNPPVVEYRGVPIVDVIRRNARIRRPSAVHHEQGRDRLDVHAIDVTEPTRRRERDVAVGQVARLDVVEPRPAAGRFGAVDRRAGGELPQAGPVAADLVEVIRVVLSLAYAKSTRRPSNATSGSRGAPRSFAGACGPARRCGPNPARTATPAAAADTTCSRRSRPSRRSCAA